MAGLPGAVKHPPLIRSGEEESRSRDALDVPLVPCSGRQKSCVRRIREMRLVIHSPLSVFDLHFLSHKITSATIATWSVRLNVGGKKEKDLEAVLLEVTAVFPHSCKSANIQVKVSNDSDRSWNRWQVRDEKQGGSSNWLWGVTVEDRVELVPDKWTAFSCSNEHWLGSVSLDCFAHFLPYCRLIANVKKRTTEKCKGCLYKMLIYWV